MSLANSSHGSGKIREILENGNGSIHFLGIMGAGMLPLARLLKALGLPVSGTDREESALKLENEEIKIAKYGTGEYIDRARALVYTLAVGEDSLEILQAKDRGIPLISRAELLGTLMQYYKNRIGVSGSHGKSSTTAIITELLKSSFDPTVVSGALLCSGSGLRVGATDTFVYEACEYRDSFLCTSPTVAVCLGVELDHTDYFKSREQIEDSFLKFLNKADLAVVNSDDEGVKRIIDKIESEVITYGKNESASYRYEVKEADGKYPAFTVYNEGRLLGEYSTLAIGDYLPSNMTAAIAVAHQRGVDASLIKKGISEYTGIGRRLEGIGFMDGRAVYYDYAHHPTEIKASVNTIRRIHGKCTVVFRSHTYSRTVSFWDDFIRALRLSDYVCLVDTYAAREKKAVGKDARQMAQEIGENAEYMEPCDVFRYVKDKTEGAVILMGAGDIDGIKKDFEAYMGKDGKK